MLKKLYIYLYIGLAFHAQAYGQLIYNQAVMHIGEETLVKVNGGVNNQLLISNHGHVKVSGDWLNHASYQANKGTVTLDGNASQHINHHANTFYNLRIEGGSEKVFVDTLYIAGEISLSNGIVNAEQGAFLVIEDNATIKGGNFDSFVSGTLYHEGTGNKFYPVGRYGYYYPLILESVRGSNPVTGIYYEEPNPTPMAGTNLDSVSQSRYWQRVQASGTFEEAYVTLIVDEMDGITEQDMDRLVVTEADSITQYFRSLGVSEILGTHLDGTVRSEVAATAKVFALGFASEKQVQGIFYVPTAFSPFSATQEDDQYARVYGENIAEEGFVFRVFNQWGNLVYESKSFIEANTKGWDGRNFQTLVDMQAGVYTYILNGQFEGGASFQDQGTITLIK